MSSVFILFLVASAVAVLLVLVLYLKVSAFISLLITAIYVGILTGMPLNEITNSIKDGMAGTLGFVATVVGLGAIFGQMLESSGGAQSLAHHLTHKFGKEKASWALMLTGFFVAIPVFFDVGLIVLVPIVYALSRDAKKPLLYYGIPLLAGLAVTHTFIPPTPGPVAVAAILNADLGWVILFGFIIGLPTAILAGPIWGKAIAKKINIQAPTDIFVDVHTNQDPKTLPSFRMIVIIIAIPLVLILLSTVTSILTDQGVFEKSILSDVVSFCGHPFIALIIATLLAIYFLAVRRGVSKQEILDLSTKALGPAGIIILITGAGGVLKQVLIDSGIGQMMAESIAASTFPPILLAWILAAVVRITQGSSTVAMITAAGIISPFLNELSLNDPQRALIVLSIASGATILSHVNDSGFWLVSKYFGMNEKQTLQSWTVMETIISVSGLLLALLINTLL